MPTHIAAQLLQFGHCMLNEQLGVCLVELISATHTKCYTDPWVLTKHYTDRITNVHIFWCNHKHNHENWEDTNVWTFSNKARTDQLRQFVMWFTSPVQSNPMDCWMDEKTDMKFTHSQGEPFQKAWLAVGINSKSGRMCQSRRASQRAPRQASQRLSDFL